ncbi:MAG TPA: nitrilase-related carbon-nitrogen hydrolase [Conexibacter sp.]|nr:nitrilase-related carbon-nitrogen hydrolase [Conexibacter sp.]
MSAIEVIAAVGSPPPSPARVEPPRRAAFRVGAVQQRWHPDPVAHEAALAEGIRLAADRGARLVCLQELTLSPYFAVDEAPTREALARAEAIPDGPTTAFARRMAAETGAYVHASLYERAAGDAGGADDPRGFNTAICVAPGGALVARTRKLHIPVTAGYREDRWFRPGPADADSFPVVGVGEAQLAFPTCWDQWFPELARAYALAGADAIVYPTAIGSEPDHPEFDTEPLWERVIVANGIANGTFMVAVNRIGTEARADGGTPLTFYGSSFVSDPYGRILAQAPRDRPAVLVADLDLDQRRDWLDLFPFLRTRRPDAYGPLTTS